MNGFYGLRRLKKTGSPTVRYECDSCIVCGYNRTNGGGKTRHELADMAVHLFKEVIRIGTT